MQANIEPVTFFRDSATIIRVDGAQIRSLGEGGRATIICTLLSSDGRSLSNQVVEMAGDDYNAWGSDDEYVLNHAIFSLGLTRVTA